MMNDSTNFAKSIRKETLKLIYNAKASHIGGAFSMVDILAVLYTQILNINPSNPKDPDRDRFFLSKGHACTSLYSTLSLLGFFSKNELENYAKNGSMLMAHANHKVPGVELSTGSLGHALGVASGVALAGKINNKSYSVYVLLSDGELDEGSNWEAILFAAQHKLSNLIVIIDYNKIQSLGRVSEVINLESLTKKFEAFNWNVHEIDGHNHTQLLDSLKNTSTTKPTAIIAHTIKGKGVDFMEDKLLWHYKSPDENEYNKGLSQIEKG